MNKKDEKILDTVLKGLKYEPLNDVLLKPLAPEMVKKEFTEQIPNGKQDENGYNLYDVKTEVKEVESEFGLGIVLTVPEKAKNDLQYKVGDKVVYNRKFGKWFDLFKDSVLVKPYDIIAVVKG